MTFGVRDRQGPTPDLQIFGQPRGLVVQDDFWFTAARARHFDVEPAHLCAPASAECLHDRLFGGKSAGITFIFAAQFFFTIGDLFLGEHTIAKTPADARIFQRCLNTVDLGQVHAGADDHGCASRSAVCAPCSSPHRHMASTTGFKLFPSGVSSYSTFGGTWA